MPDAENSRILTISDSPELKKINYKIQHFGSNLKSVIQKQISFLTLLSYYL